MVQKDTTRIISRIDLKTAKSWSIILKSKPENGQKGAKKMS